MPRVRMGAQTELCFQDPGLPPAFHSLSGPHESPHVSLLLLDG